MAIDVQNDVDRHCFYKEKLMLNFFSGLLFCILLLLGGQQQPVLDVPEPLLYRMASVAKGESGIDLTHPACVMRNRIIAGWNPSRVLNHFYASPAYIDGREYELARRTILYGDGCDPRAYFQWSLNDESRIKPNSESFLFGINGNVYYDVNALRGR